MAKRKLSPGGTREWVAAAAKKLKTKSLEQLEVMATAAFMRNEDDNSEMIFAAAMQALMSKSRKAYDRVYNKLVDFTEEQERTAEA